MRSLLLTLLALLLALSPAHAEDLRLAVTPFTSGTDDPNLVPLGKGLQSMFTTDLSNVPGLEVVERARLQEIVAELELQATTLVDPATAAEAGRLLGATHLLTGSFTLLGDQLRLDARLFSVTGGDVLVAESRTGERDVFFDLQKQLVSELVKELAGDVSPKVRVKIQRVHTADWGAFAAYSRGVDLIDTADYDAAVAELQKATTLDEDFDLAAVTLDEANRLVLELQTKAEAVAAVERERSALDKAVARTDNQRKAAAVVDRLMALASTSGPEHRRERLTALWLLTQGYLNIQGRRTNAIYIVGKSADDFAMRRTGEALAARYLAEAIDAWPAVPVTLDTEVYPTFPLHDSFDADFAAAVAFVHGEDAPDEHRASLRRGLTRLDATVDALRLDRKEALELAVKLEPLGRSLPMDDRTRWNQESLMRQSIRILDADRALRMAHALSQSTEDSGDLRDLAALADDARRVKEAIETSEHPERVAEYLMLALHNSKSLDWATETAPKELGAAEPTERGWSLLLEERRWGPEFLWLGEHPTWMIQGRGRAATGPRTDPRRAEVVQWVSDYAEPDPGLLLVGGTPVAEHDVTLRLSRTKGTDRPGPLPKGTAEVWWLFGMEDVDVDMTIVDSKSVFQRPTRALRVRLGTDAVVLERIEESKRDSWDKDEWRVVEELARQEVRNKRDLTVRVQVQGTTATVTGDGVDLSADLGAAPMGYLGAWFDGAGFAELEID